MQNRYLYSLRIILVGIDCIFINLAFILAYCIVTLLNYNFSTSYFIQLMLVNNLFWVLNANFLHLYHKKSIYSSSLLFSLRWKCGLIHLLLFSAHVFLISGGQVTYIFFVLFYLLLNVHLICSQLTYQVVEPLLKVKFKFKKPVALIGLSATSLPLSNFLKQSYAQYDLASFLDQHECIFSDETDTSLTATCKQIQLAAENGINNLYIALSPERINEVPLLLSEAHNHCVRLKFVPDFHPNLAANIQKDHVNALTLINANAEPFEDMSSRFIKRLFDILFSAGVILFIFSWLYPVLAILIKYESKGPVLFKQLRSGKNNINFWCYKFRSMTVNEGADSLQASKYDDRITKIGRFMRKTSLDELPQFFNVLMGSMSIVGPRPHMLKHTEQYRSLIDKYMVRHYLKPGITGWAQINGFRGETKHIPQMKKRVEHDIWYLENWSVTLDLKIIFLTVTNVFQGEENAY